MSDFSEVFRRRNEETAGNWSQFSSHRDRVCDLIESLAPGGSLCVVGAGNCNDLDLPRLLARFESVTLVDLDRQAVEQGAARQLGDQQPERLALIEADVTGAFGLMHELAGRGQALESADLQLLFAALQVRPLPAELGRTFDLVISTCLLSQLIDALKRVVGEAPQRFVPMVQAVRRQHVGTLLDLTKPGGTAVLVFDFVSSVTVPGLAEAREEDLPRLADELVAQGNFFTGLRPAAVLEEAGFQVQSRGLASPPSMLGPWRWDMGARVYLVAAAAVTNS
jgi:SAM-dependent methyltransferase